MTTSTPAAAVRLFEVSLSRDTAQGTDGDTTFAADARGWPRLDTAALHGLAGDVVAAVDPHTEADWVAVLVSFLAAFGNAVGAGPHHLVGSTRHCARINAVLVGASSRSRKGESWQPVRHLMRAAAKEWADARVQSGLSSGEGVIAAVRDAVEQRDTKGERRIIEAGVDDKRLLVVEAEFARTLKVMRRDGSTLSAVLREGFDTGDLRVMTKTQARATGAHVSILAHITETELHRELDDTSLWNGFANRFLWLGVKRSKTLPEPEPFRGAKVEALATRIAGAIAFADGVDVVGKDDDASTIWREVYPDMTADSRGLAGAVTSRAEAFAVRLALTYALLDTSEEIRREHLLAALAVVTFAEQSARRIFGDRLGDPIADTIWRALPEHDGEMTRTDLRDLFHRHVSTTRMNAALDELRSAGLIDLGLRDTGGRPVEVVRLLR